MIGLRDSSLYRFESEQGGMCGVYITIVIHLLQWIYVMYDQYPEETEALRSAIKNTVEVWNICSTDNDYYELYCYLYEEGIDYISDIMKDSFPVYNLCEDEIPKGAYPLFQGKDYREYENGFLLEFTKTLTQDIVLQLEDLEDWYGEFYQGEEHSYYLIYGYSGLGLEGFPADIVKELKRLK